MHVAAATQDTAETDMWSHCPQNHVCQTCKETCELILCKVIKNWLGHGGIQQKHARVNAPDVFLYCSSRTQHQSKQTRWAVFASMFSLPCGAPWHLAAKIALQHSSPPGLNASKW